MNQKSRDTHMTDGSVDILMITCQRPQYTARSLPALLDSADARTRVWVWHNGNDQATLDVVQQHRAHPRFTRFHHCPENTLVREASNWLFSEAQADLLGVVADDCIVDPDWIPTFREAHLDEPQFGVLACWHFALDDFDATKAERKTKVFTNGHRVMLNPWVQGSGVLMKRACIGDVGSIPDSERGFTSHCIRIAQHGWINGWYIPLIPIDHMDDPRSEHTLLRSDADLDAYLPLSAKVRGVSSVMEWKAHLVRSAHAVLDASPNPNLYVGWRRTMLRTWMRLTGSLL